MTKVEPIHPLKRGATGIFTPLVEALDEFLHWFPCNIIGHHWVEIPESLRGGRDRTRLRFRCSRCYLTGGFR